MEEGRAQTTPVSAAGRPFSTRIHHDNTFRQALSGKDPGEFMPLGSGFFMLVRVPAMLRHHLSNSLRKNSQRFLLPHLHGVMLYVLALAWLCVMTTFTAHASEFYSYWTVAYTGGASILTGIDSEVSINDEGAVAFVGFVQTTSGQQAVVRARYQQVIFLDFDPYQNFSCSSQPIPIRTLSQSIGEPFTDSIE